MTKPLISTILPAYNAQGTIVKTVASLLDQTFKDFELIIVDDGSTDKTFELLARIQDPRVKVLQNTHNVGIARTMNRALDESSGRFIAVANADDLYVTQRFEKQLEAMLRTKAHVCSGWFLLQDGKDSIIQHSEANDSIKSSMLFINQIGNPFVMLDGDFIRKHRIRYDETMSCAVDYAMWLHIIQNHPDAVFYNVQEVLGVYNFHALNVSSRKENEQRKNATRAQLPVIRMFYPGVSGRDMLLHQRMFYGSFNASTPELFQEMRQWILRIDRANRKAGYFDVELFHDCSREWLKFLCASNLQFPEQVESTLNKYVFS